MVIDSEAHFCDNARMQLLEVIPIGKGMSKESLTYFSKDTFPLGSLLSVPVRKKYVSALLVASTSVEDAKSEIKSLPYEIRKVEGLVAEPFLTSAFMKALSRYATWTLASRGALLSALVPKNISPKGAPRGAPRASRVHEFFVSQCEDSERLAEYKSRIREDFAKGRSVYIAVPTAEDALRIHEELSKGITEWCHLLSSDMTAKKLEVAWSTAVLEEHPIAVVATGQFLSLPRADWGTFIFERESSRGWKQQARPFVDYRTFGEMLSKEYGAHCIFGDLVVRAETVARFESREALPFGAVKSRLLWHNKAVLLSMRTTSELRPKDEKPRFSLLSDALTNAITKTRTEDGNTIILTARRGLSPVTLCADCNQPVSCNKCSGLVTLHTGKAENFFLCHRCGERRSAAERCGHCQSWRLTTLGVGSEGVETALKTALPSATILRLDADTAKTPKQARALVDRFYATPGAVIVTTEMGLQYLRSEVALVAVASIDSLFSLPDFRIAERALALLLRARSLAREYFLMQTRLPESPVFSYAERGTVADFQREELEMRRTFGYPPSKVLLKLTAEGKKQDVATLMEKAVESLKPLEADVFPAFVPGKAGRVSMHAVVKVPPSEWPSAVVQGAVATLPPSVSVNVEPDTLL